MDREEIKNLFIQGIDCSQVVAGAFAKELGMELVETASREGWQMVHVRKAE